MNPQQAYLTEPLTLEFEATIIQQQPVAGGQVDLILEKTYFYPSGGGQEHDTGRLGDSRVIDVFTDEAGNVVHRVEGEPGGPVVTARIDAERRFGHMQHHSAQHILSRALEEVLGLETLSVRIRADAPATLDVPDAALSEADLARVEALANRIVFENRIIKTTFITQDQVETIPFRRPPKVSGQIRVVEVDSFDYSACGGTHCPQTGMIGLIKIVKTERQNQKLRLHFVAGYQALATFQQAHSLVGDLCRQLSTGPEELAQLVALQVEQLQTAQRELKALQEELLSLEADKLVDQAQPVDDIRVVTRVYQDRGMGELRILAKRLQAQENLVALLAGYDGQKLALVVSCGQETGLDARELLRRHLDQIEGRGGGDARLAQGGGQATTAQVEQVFERTRDHLKGGR